MRKCIAIAAIAFVAGCSGEPGLEPGRRDLPRDRAFSPSIAEDRAARAEGINRDSASQRARLDRFFVSSADLRTDWPEGTIAFEQMANDKDREVYIRRALGRFALIQARERGLGVRLDKVRRAARTTSPATSGEWWLHAVHRGDLLAGQRGQRLALPDLVMATVRNSYQIAAFGDLPAIRGTAIQEAKGRFVPEFFADVSSERRRDWATSPAVSAGAERAITAQDQAEFGVRSRLMTGGEVSISQRFGTVDTNRTSYIPGRQASSESVITYVQPLMRGAGINYNDMPRRLANRDTQIAIEEFRRQAESHLLEVERAYWNLYVARAVYVQKQNLAAQGGRISNQLSQRGQVDVDPLLSSRARSLASQWQADMVRAKAAMENAEFRLAALSNDPRLGPGGVEILPSSAPNGALAMLSVNDTLEAVLNQRPELQQAILQYSTALIREGMAANESLPELDLVLEARAQGGATGRNIGQALGREASGFGSLIGLKFSVPLGFDERDARYHRRRLETVQQERQVLSALSSVLLEVDVAANEYIVACNDLVAQRRVFTAASADNRALRARWDEGLGEGADLLSALLNSYQARQQAEQAVAQARAAREVAAANLARARGQLLDRWGLSMELRRDIRGEQTYRLVRTGN